ncbi:hypothetical protein HY631_03380 [Candidatus Uhrbacteria bacterium]|nr:hypothetical protein [Candidatus Uhrbacteria bacterium]
MQTITTQQKLRHIYRASIDLADLVEDLLEKTSDFDPKFLTGLQRSIKEVDKGKTRKVGSLLELV